MPQPPSTPPFSRRGLMQGLLMLLEEDGCAASGLPPTAVSAEEQHRQADALTISAAGGDTGPGVRGGTCCWCRIAGWQQIGL